MRGLDHADTQVTLGRTPPKSTFSIQHSAFNIQHKRSIKSPSDSRCSINSVLHAADNTMEGAHGPTQEQSRADGTAEMKQCSFLVMIVGGFAWVIWGQGSVDAD